MLYHWLIQFYQKLISFLFGMANKHGANQDVAAKRLFQ